MKGTITKAEEDGDSIVYEVTIDGAPEGADYLRVFVPKDAKQTFNLLERVELTFEAPGVLRGHTGWVEGKVEVWKGK